MAANPETGFRGTSPNGAGADPDEEDHYSLLGVPFTATHAEITRAYRRAIKRAHPDRQRPERREAAEEFARRLNAAYTMLS
ncbi:MAG: J domain-containing protein, partial [Thermomicrobiales bacterium]